MNIKSGIWSAIINSVSVMSFAVCMILENNYGSYIASMFIAFSFVPMMCSFYHYSNPDVKVPGLISVAFASAYLVLILAVYYAQVTTIRFHNLDEHALQILDYKRFGLLFNYDLLGYGIMALSTFFAGFTIKVKSNTDRLLKWLLFIHGIFFVSSFLSPILNLFHNEMKGEVWIGKAILLFWCFYFLLIGFSSIRYFNLMRR